MRRRARRKTEYKGARPGMVPYHKTNIPAVYNIQGELFQLKGYKPFDKKPVFYRNTLLRKFIITVRIAYYVVRKWVNANAGNT